jgi:hypothetical protein
MKGYDLFEYSESSEGKIDPIVDGINKRRIGYDRKTVECWFEGGNYSNDFIDSVMFGYDNAFNESVINQFKPRSIFERDTFYILDKLKRYQNVSDISFTQPYFEKTVNISKCITSMTGEHNDYDLKYTISINEMISSDTKYLTYWNVDIHVRCDDVNARRKGFKVCVDKVLWFEDNYEFDSTSTSFQYRHSEVKKFAQHSSSVSKFLEFISDDLVKQYHLQKKTN